MRMSAVNIQLYSKQVNKNGHRHLTDFSYSRQASHRAPVWCGTEASGERQQHRQAAGDGQLAVAGAAGRTVAN